MYFVSQDKRVRDNDSDRKIEVLSGLMEVL